MKILYDIWFSPAGKYIQHRACNITSTEGQVSSNRGLKFRSWTTIATGKKVWENSYQVCLFCFFACCFLWFQDGHICIGDREKEIEKESKDLLNSSIYYYFSLFSLPWLQHFRGKLAIAPVDTGHKLNVHKTSEDLRLLMYVQFTSCVYGGSGPIQRFIETCLLYRRATRLIDLQVFIILKLEVWNTPKSQRVLIYPSK